MMIGAVGNRQFPFNTFFLLGLQTLISQTRSIDLTPEQIAEVLSLPIAEVQSIIAMSLEAV
jgi:hypothetical protein